MSSNQNGEFDLGEDFFGDSDTVGSKKLGVYPTVDYDDEPGENNQNTAYAAGAFGALSVCFASMFKYLACRCKQE